MTPKLRFGLIPESNFKLCNGPDILKNIAEGGNMAWLSHGYIRDFYPPQGSYCGGQVVLVGMLK
jgi:hypothetical protein